MTQTAVQADGKGGGTMKKGIILLLTGAITLAGCEQVGVAPEPTATPTVESVAARSIVAAEATL